MSRIEEKIRDTNDRQRLVKKWPARIKKMAKGFNKFCDDHELDRGQTSRWVNGVNQPEWESIHKVESALAAEGV